MAAKTEFSGYEIAFFISNELLASCSTSPDDISRELQLEFPGASIVVRATVDYLGPNAIFANAPIPRENEVFRRAAREAVIRILDRR